MPPNIVEHSLQVMRVSLAITAKEETLKLILWNREQALAVERKIACFMKIGIHRVIQAIV